MENIKKATAERSQAWAECISTFSFNSFIIPFNLISSSSSSSRLTVVVTPDIVVCELGTAWFTERDWMDVAVDGRDICGLFFYSIENHWEKKRSVFVVPYCCHFFHWKWSVLCGEARWLGKRLADCFHCRSLYRHRQDEMSYYRILRVENKVSSEKRERGILLHQVFQVKLSLCMKSHCLVYKTRKKS